MTCAHSGLLAFIASSAMPPDRFPLVLSTLSRFTVVSPSHSVSLSFVTQEASPTGRHRYSPAEDKHQPIALALCPLKKTTSCKRHRTLSHPIPSSRPSLAPLHCRSIPDTAPRTRKPSVGLEIVSRAIGGGSSGSVNGAQRRVTVKSSRADVSSP